MLNFFKTTNEKENTTYLFVNSFFAFKALNSIIKASFETFKIETYKLKSKENSLIIDFNIEEKKDILTSSRLRFLQKENIISVFAELVSIRLDNYSETIIPLKTEVSKLEVFKAIQNHILEAQNDGLYALRNKEGIDFVQETNPFTKNYIFHQLNNDDYVLAILNISSITFKKDLKTPKDTKWYFVLTSTKKLLIGTTKDSFSSINISSEKIKIKEAIGRDTVSGDSFTFLTELMNDNYYTSILPAIKATNNRLDIFTDCLLKSYNNKTEYLELASRAYYFQYKQSSLKTHELKSDLIKYLESFKINDKQEKPIIDVLKKHSIDSTLFGNNLVEIVISWELSYKTKFDLSKLLFKTQDITAIKNSIYYQTYFRTLFLEKEKNEEHIFEFNLKYAKALTKASFFSKAILVYNTIYDTLPDDSITDLLPGNKTNLLKGESDRLLKISILESILESEKKAKLDTSKTLIKLAQLQPLLQSRIEALKTVDNYKNKANTIINVMHLKDMQYNNIDYEEEYYNKLNKTQVLKNVVPECFKNANGFFDTLNTYIATIKQPNYDAVIAFSDKLTKANYPYIHKDITNICYALKINTPECYIGRANYSNVIIGVEGKPNYLIIGNDFIDSNSDRQLNFNELKFLIAIELAHIYFEHSKITSTDVWRGAAEKGFSVINVLLTVLPFAGSIGGMLGNFVNIEKYSKIFNKVEKASNVIEKGQNIIDIGEKLNINSLNKSNTTNNSQDLLITSRLMEIIADKVALLFCNDLNAAIKSIISSSKLFEEEVINIERYNLSKLLERTNENDEFYYQETIIRIKNLCAFYLSDTYELLKNKLKVN
ncbi:hypothetical protein [uncultured Lacinutrix sp.]|uniref:hypothetical protein n=1 Tax=uncultured Lacinutrix sp. TaxID=574032 RepID=UPI0026294D31|nr:hypothetical protein [uncultured Lacinutrix sp.]